MQKTIINSLLIGSISTLLIGCQSPGNLGSGLSNFLSGSSVVKNTNSNYAPTNANNVHLYFSSKPKRHYIEIGQASIEADNMLGIPKGETEIMQAMKAQAALIGGDAVMDIHRNAETATGTVIKYINNEK